MKPPYTISGKKGGEATKKKYGKDYFKKIASKPRKRIARTDVTGIKITANGFVPDEPRKKRFPKSV